MEQFLETFFDLTGNLGATITLVITFLTALSLLIANLARYLQAKRYGIPLKMIQQANIPDSLELWGVFISILGFGFLIPNFIGYLAISSWLVFVIVLVSSVIFLATLQTQQSNFTASVRSSDTAQKHQLSFKTSRMGFKSALITATVTATTFAYLHFAIGLTSDTGFFHHALTTVATVIRFGYNAFAWIMLVVSILLRLFGNKQAVTVDLDGQNYLIALQHNNIQWILMPCTLVENENQKTVEITRGNFIIRDLSRLDRAAEIVYRSEYNIGGQISINIGDDDKVDDVEIK